jgi:hypothetical protein
MKNLQKGWMQNLVTPSLNILSKRHDVKYKLATLDQGASQRELFDFGTTTHI